MIYDFLLSTLKDMCYFSSKSSRTARVIQWESIPQAMHQVSRSGGKFLQSWLSKWQDLTDSFHIDNIKDFNLLIYFGRDEFRCHWSQLLQIDVFIHKGVTIIAVFLLLLFLHQLIDLISKKIRLFSKRIKNLFIIYHHWKKRSQP